MGSLEHLPVFWQSFCFQAMAPWASRIPPPDIVKSSTCWIVIHSASPLNLLGSGDAFIVPCIWRCMGPLHGPSRLTAFIKNVPFGIVIVLGASDAHASFQQLNIALAPKNTKSINQAEHA